MENLRTHTSENLNPQEINDPMLVLSDFFSSDDVPGHLRELFFWRSCVLEDRYYLDGKGNPSGILFTYQLHIKMIEALHQLAQPGSSKLMMTTAIHSVAKLEAEKQLWSYYPEDLTKAELLNPLIILKEFFKTYTLRQYCDFLYEWLEYSLSINGAREFIETIDLITVYERLQKLYAAAWLMHQRTTDRPYLKDNQFVSDQRELLAAGKVQLYQLDKVIYPEKQEVISKLVAIIKHKLETVQAVIFLGITPDKSETFYLCILTANEEKRQAQALSSMIEESCQLIANVVALVHYHSFITQRERGNNAFVQLVLGCPVVYLSGDIILPDKQLHSVVIKEEIQESKWNHWYTQGKDFLNGANYYIERRSFNTALFSLHQCAECLLTAIIKAILGYRVSSHNLSNLLRLTQMFTSDIAGVFNLSDDENIELFELLKQAYVNVRYKDVFSVDYQAVVALFSVLTRLEETVTQVYQSYLLTKTL
jgi:HEPN domain-containing protein